MIDMYVYKYYCMVIDMKLFMQLVSILDFSIPFMFSRKAICIWLFITLRLFMTHGYSYGGNTLNLPKTCRDTTFALLWTRRSYFRFRTFRSYEPRSLSHFWQQCLFRFRFFLPRPLRPPEIKIARRARKKILSNAKHWPEMVHTLPCINATAFPSCRPPYVRHNSATHEMRQ